MVKQISSSITIAARQEQVWDVIADFASYSDWNPFIQAVSGSPIVGSRLHVRVCPPGGKPMSFKPTILVARPSQELRWKGRLVMPGLFDGEHYFHLSSVEGGTLLTQGERFSGLLVSLVGSTLFDQTEQGFRAMNEAVRQRVETGSRRFNRPA